MTSALGLLMSAVGRFPVPAFAVDPCSVPSANPIPCEDSQPGTSSSTWDVIGSGSSYIQGFATDISVNVGGTISFKIKTDSDQYTLTIYRMGYYQGNGARQIAVVTPSALLPQPQPNCLTDSSSGLIDCGNWAVSASWTVPSNAVSGIYFARVADTGNRLASQIPFVVRNDASTSDIVFKTNDTTWLAYNNYGGTSLYSGSGPAPDGRAYKVSYNRPFNDRSQAPGDGAANYVFYGEYPMVRWLEMNGYDVSYTTSVDVERSSTLLRNHRVLLSSGHDEYWSAGERAAVEGARDAGVNIAQFTGNEAFWKIRWENSIDGSASPYRTLVSYKETLANRVTDPKDPPTWTGSWRDPRFSPPADGGRPENSLGGTIFMVNRGSGAPIISSDFSKLRIWRNTTVATLSPGASVTLGSQTIGYEWDEDLDNGSRPAGLFDLSSTTLSVPEVLQDYGGTYAPGTAVHSLTMYRAPSGALVFGAGTVQWAWGLDVFHDTSPDTGPAAPDVTMQQATVNLLADMGAQPSTLQANLVATPASTDTTPPASTITAPSAGASITVGSSVTISGTASDSGGVVAAVEVSVDGGTTWHRAAGTSAWSYSWTAGGPSTVTFKSRAVDDSGNLEVPSVGVTVTVVPHTCPCSLFPSTATPATVAVSDPVAIELGVRFSVDTPGFVNGVAFYKSSQNTGTHSGSLWTATGTLLAAGTFTSETASGWQTMLFSTPVAVRAGTVYVASYHTIIGYYSSTGSYFSNQYDAWPMHAPASSNGVYAYGPSQFPTQSFNATNYWVDALFTSNLHPAVTTTTPPSGANGVSVATTASATFNKDVVASSIQFTLTGPNSTPVQGTIAYDATTQTATFTPTAQLAQGTTYTAAVNGATDASGNTMTGPFSWPFTTVACCSLFPAASAPTTITVNDSSAIELGMKFTADVNGSVSAVRFYKGPTNTGTHVGNLWNSTGQRLATATFTSETASGWQQVAFSPAVNITAGTTYVVSYHTNVGFYSADGGAFASAINNPPLHGVANSVSANGVYLYSPSSVFPTQSFNATNYWVDVVFSTTVDTTPPTVVATSPAANATGVPASRAVTATFSESVAPSSIQFTLTGPGGASVAGTVSYSDPSWTASFQPSAPLALGTLYTATVSGATDLAGNKMTGPATWGFTTLTCPCSLFAASATPTNVTINDPGAVEVGMKFTSDVNGSVTGARFYKGPSNTGTHVGSIWTSAGQLLATATFNSETASGWQQVSFSTPVNITVGTTYLVSYHTNAGFYSADGGAFAAAIDNAPLHGVANSVSANGVYLYTASSAFPTQSFNATNYWVDVVFSTSQVATAPAVVATSPAASATGAALSGPVTATFNKSVVQSSIQFTVTGPGGASVAGVLSYNDPTLTASFQPGAALAEGTAYTATVSGATDAAGNTMTGPYTWSFTSLTCPCSLFPSNATPAVQSSGDANAIELGVTFQPDVNGFVNGIRFYKGSANTGTHIGNLWSSSRQLLATATFSNESASGWQQVTFASPVAVTANTTYVASYHTGTGNYSYTGAVFSSSVDSGPLHAPAASNGLFIYGASQFPTQSFNATNYWVDLVFNTTRVDTVPPAVVATSPVANATGVPVAGSITATFNKSVVQSSIHFSVTGPGSTTVAGTLTYNDSNHVASFQPSPALAAATTYTASVSGAADASGNTMTAPDTWSFTTLNCPCSLFAASATPTRVNANDAGAVELGMKFTSDVSGSVTAVRFYKSTANTGTHIGNLWSATGQLLATATFTNETASGWQQVTFTTPVAITAGATYVVSYHTDVGFYSADGGSFASAIDNPPLHGVANSVSANGVYAYGASQFPNQSFNATNYWVDVVFNTS